MNAVGDEPSLSKKSLLSRMITFNRYCFLVGQTKWIQRRKAKAVLAGIDITWKWSKQALCAMMNRIMCEASGVVVVVGGGVDIC